jgi:hypothetical protein
MMTEQMNEDAVLQADEHVVLSKFEGDPVPENEFERLTVENGVVLSHDRIENGEVVGTVEDSDLVGKDIGRLTS